MRKGQSTAEYAIVVGVVIAAAIAMQVYMRRSVQAHVKDVYDFSTTANYTAESADETFANMFKTGQYEPGFVQSSLRTTENTSKALQLQDGGGVVTNMTRGESTRTGNVTYTTDATNVGP